MANVMIVHRTIEVRRGRGGGARRFHHDFRVLPLGVLARAVEEAGCYRPGSALGDHDGGELWLVCRKFSNPYGGEIRFDVSSGEKNAIGLWVLFLIRCPMRNCKRQPADGFGNRERAPRSVTLAVRRAPTSVGPGNRKPSTNLEDRRGLELRKI